MFLLECNFVALVDRYNKHVERADDTQQQHSSHQKDGIQVYGIAKMCGCTCVWCFASDMLGG